MIFYLETYKEFKHKIEKILNEFSKPERHKKALENILNIYAFVIISPNREIIKQFNLHLLIKEKKLKNKFNKKGKALYNERYKRLMKLNEYF
jgi:hypothetical protein